MCVAEAMMFYTDIIYVEAAQRVIAAKAEVGYKININIVPMFFRHRKVKIQISGAGIRTENTLSHVVSWLPNIS